MLLDRVAKRVLAGDDREDVVAGDELEVVDDPEVGRVRHRDGQRPSVLLEGEDEVLRREIGGDHLRDFWINFEFGEVHCRHAVLPRQHLRQLGLLDEAQLDEVVPDTGPACFLFLKRLFELFLGDQTFLDQQVAQTLSGGGYRCGHECSVCRERSQAGRCAQMVKVFPTAITVKDASCAFRRASMTEWENTVTGL
jgi:hypothetical protein